jgi:nucleoside-diphosphate-sugar epimerase
MSEDAILLTGVTGFLGMETLARLIDRGEESIFVMVRAEDDDDAERRLAQVLARLYEEPGAIADRVQVVRGDLLQPGLGLSREVRLRLLASVDRIVHCAASISFELPLEEARAINVTGAARILELAREIAARGILRRLVHVSTAYVSGRHTGPFREDDLLVGQTFRNTYESSKFEAERLLRYATDLPVVIARPSIVVGDHRSGWTPAFNVIYGPIRAAERGLLKEVPARPDSIVDFVPVDYVTDGLIALLDDPGSSGTYHLVSGEQAMTTGELVHMQALASSAEPVLLIDDHTGRPTPGMEAYAPYFDVRCSFDDARARAALERAGVEKPEPREYLGRLIAYAHETRWGKRPVSREAAMRLVGTS